MKAHEYKKKGRQMAKAAKARLDEASPWIGVKERRRLEFELTLGEVLDEQADVLERLGEI